MYVCEGVCKCFQVRVYTVCTGVCVRVCVCSMVCCQGHVGFLRVLSGNEQPSPPATDRFFPPSLWL